MKINLKNKKLWIIAGIVLAVIAVAVAATVLIVNLTADNTDTDASANKIYWNIDRLVYYGQGQGGASGRELSTEDGYYHVLFCVDGRPSERKIRSLTVVNKIDNNDAMGLVVDEKTRNITDIVPIDEISGGFLFRKMYVKEVKGTEITVNSSATFMGDEKTIKVKTTTPILDVSLQAGDSAGLPVKLESIEKKDQISVILNKDESIYAVYIVKRSKITPIYWNIERKYDSKYKATTREPDADGVYHFNMAVRGQQVDVKVKDRQLASKIDSVGSRCCGLNFDDDGYAIEYVSPTKCTGGKSVASWADVMSMDGLEFMAEKHSKTAYDNGKQFNLILDPDCEVYNVSENHKEFIGEVTELQTTDRIQGFTDATGRVVVVFVVIRREKCDIYWNAYRMWDSTKKVSTRKREADGYFHFIMCHDGKTEEILVANADIANKMDEIASRTMGLRFSGNVVTELVTPGKIYTSQGSWYDVEKFVSNDVIHVKKNSVTAKDYGKEYDIDLAEDCKIYNVTETYNDHIGEETTLRVGDRIQAWVDHTGKAKYIYVVGRKFTNPVTPHNSNHTCGDCGANVNWIPWTDGSSLPKTTGHYYLCGDVFPTQASILANQNVVLCLNGHKVRAAGKRIYALFEQGASLTIHDCVGTGKMYSTYAGNLGTTQGAIIWGRYGSIKLFGGTYEAPTGKADNVGPVIATNSNVEVTIKNATIKGGRTSKNGGAIYMGAGANTILRLENTTVISGQTDTGKGNAVYMKYSSKLYVSGKVNIGSSGKSDLYLESGAYVYLDSKNPLTDGSRFVLESATAGGRFTSNYTSGAEKYFVSSDPAYTVSKAATYLFLSKNTTATPHKTTHLCDHCGGEVTWTPWISTNSLPTESGHYYLCSNVETPQQNITDNQDVVLCLNGYTVKGSGNRVYAVNGTDAKLTVCDCAGNGKIYNGKTSGSFGTTQGSVFWVRKGELNIFGGTYQATTATLPGFGSLICEDGSANTINISGATLIGGPTDRDGGVMYIKSAATSLKDVTIKAGKAAGKGDAVYMDKGTTLTVSGKVNITGGSKAQVYLADGAYIKLGGALTSGSHIGVTTATLSGKFTTNYVDGAIDYFESQKSGYTIKRKNGCLFLDNGSVKPDEHKSNHKCAECGENVTWEAWEDDSSLPTETGHYYLATDVATAQKTIGDNQNVVLCLNGHTVKGTSNRVYAVNGTNAKLTVCDCTDSGKMYNGKTSGNFGTTQGGVFWVRKGTLNLSGGTYEGTTAMIPGSGGIICEDGSSGNAINIKDATLKGGFTDQNGGIIAVKSADVSLTNVVLKDGIADKKGDAVYMEKGTTLTLSGRVEISGGDDAQVYLADGALIKLGGALTSGSHIGVTTDTPNGKISTNYYDGIETYFESQKENHIVVNKSGALYLYDENKVVEAHKNAHKCDECGEDVTWEAWDDETSLPTTTGHYYLATDVETAQKTIDTENANVVLCLNGHTVKGTSNRVYAVNAANAKLTVCDCEKTGEIYNGKTTITGTTQGSVFWVRKGTLNLFGGTYKAAKSTVPGHGAAICDDGSGNTISIKNATIIGGTTAKSGGAIYKGTGGKLVLENVNITSGKATENGDAIYVAKNVSVSVSGLVKISGGDSQVYLDEGSYITFAGDLAAESHIGVNTADAEGKITTNYLSGSENFFASEKEGYSIAVKSGAIYLDDGSSTAEEHKNTHKCDECGEDVEWIAWESATSLPTTTGHYYLAVDVETEQNSINTEDTNVVLCLNGHTVKGTGNRVYAVNAENAKLTVCNCEKTGKVYNGKETITGTTQGSVFWVRNGTLNLFGGTYVAAKSTVPGHGAAICDDGSGNTINIKNANIIGGTTAKSGGAIFVNTNAKLSLTDVEITAGTATDNGDAIYMGKNATLTVSGKVAITGGKEQVYLGDGALIKIENGLIDGSHIGVNTDKADGKITSNYLDGAENYFESNREKASIKVENNAIWLIKPPHIDHKCEECGEDVEWTAWTDAASLPTTTGHYYLATDVEAGQHTINTENANVVLCLNGHTIKGTTNRVYALNATGAKLTVCDCEKTGKIYNGKATITGTTQGSVIWVRKGTLNLFGGTYEAAKSKVPGHGAAICDDGSGNTINIKNATIIGGTTAKSGGAIFVNTNAKLSLTDVEIKAGTATDKGDAISLGKNATLTVSGKVEITGGKEQVYLSDGALIKIENGLTDGSHIGVNTDKADGKITSNYIEGAENYFESQKEGSIISQNGEYIFLSTAQNNTLSKNLNVYSNVYGLLRKAGTK